MDYSILMLLGHVYMVNIDDALKLTQGQGHKTKGEGHMFIYYFFLVSAINHELMNGS